MLRKWRNQKQNPTPKTKWEKLNWQLHVGTYTKKTYREPSEQLFSQ